MQQASNLADKVLTRQSIKSNEPSQSAKPEAPKLSQAMIDKLWLKMTEIYGHRWTSSFGVSADQSHAWASVLGGVTGMQIAHGLGALASSGAEWPPSATEFLALCYAGEADRLGLPPIDKAFDEAFRKAHPAMAGATWSHQAVYHAASESGFYNLQTLPMDASRKLFERNYAIACRLLLEGKPLKAIPLALPSSVDSRVTPEVGRAALAALRGAL